MNQKPNEFTRAKSTNPGQVSRTLWWFSTAIPEAIEHSESDRYRAKIIGLGVLFTWLYATIAWTYLWSTNIESPLVYIPLGLFIGFGILTIDRMLIASISKHRRNFFALALRVILALFLGAFIAQPLILWMFNQDIETEIAIIQEEKVMEKQQKVEELYVEERADLLSLKDAISSEKATSYQAMNNSEEMFLAEIDGTGGSMRYGIAGVAAQKEIALNRTKAEYEANVYRWNRATDSINNRLSAITSEVNQQTADFRTNDLSAGFLIRVEALMSLFEKDTTGALKKRYYLILIILIIFELIPIISKLFLQTGSYDDRIKIRDEMELEVAYSNREHEQDLKQKYNALARDADIDLLKETFNELAEKRKEKMNGNINKWQNDHIGSFDELWEKIKSEVLSRQEN